MARGGRIFLVGQKEGQLLPMDETPYATEDVLQELLAKYPDLLPGDQITPETPRAWLFVARELAVPAEEGGAGNWSLDHLFIDQDGVPTFVECKRASDTRNRREVVAQMLDYAANGTKYWPTDRVRQAATETARAAGISIDDRVKELLGTEDADVDAFWTTVETNLRSGRVRLLFVADQTPRELRRLVEFLNEKMADVEVLAVEVKQFLADEHRVVVPRVIGLTEAARGTKSAGSRPTRNRAEVLAACTPAASVLFGFMLDEAEARGHSPSWGVSGFSIGLVPPGGPRVPFAAGYPPDDFQFSTEYLAKRGLVDGDAEAQLRRDVQASGLMRAGGGRYLMSARVTDKNVEGLKRVYVEIADRMDVLAGGQ